MTDAPKPDEPAGSVSGSHAKFERKGLADHPIVRLLVIVITLSGIVITVLHTVWGVGASASDSTSAATTTGSTRTAAVAPGASASSRPTAATSPGGTAISVLATSSGPSRAMSTPANSSRKSAPVGPCLTPSHSSVPCTAPHVAEVVAQPGQACDDRFLNRYLGGDPSLDVIRVSATPLKIGGSTFCVVASDGPFRLAALANALAGDNDAYLRRCLDTRLVRTVVPCSTPHTAEFVGVADGSAPDQGQCMAAAAGYIDKPLDSISDQVTVSAIPATSLDVDHPRCLIQVLGGNLLYDSLRNLGTSALPDTPR